MKHLTVPVLLAGSLIALSTMEAGAVVCAHGVVHAGCVAAGGAAVETTAPVVTAPVCAVESYGGRSNDLTT
jgi:hypothetical protein